ncbi:MAG: SPFH domain-containing protein, partial [Acidobacteriota bacterium]
MAKERFTGILVPTILISVVLITLPAVFDYVPNHHRGIVTREDGSVRFVEPGLHLRIAGVHPRPASYPLQNLTLEGTAALRTRDGVTLRGEFTATVRIAPTDLLNFHRQRGDRPVLAAIRQEVATSLEQAARSRTA